MADDRLLDEVADRLAELPARLTRVTLDQPKGGSRWPAPLHVLVDLPWVASATIRMLRQLRSLPDDEETRRLYRQATGADHDRARADVGAVVDRLTPLEPEELVRRASAWLVRWVAEGRPVWGPRHDDVEALFAELHHDRPTREAVDPSDLVHRRARYVVAWRVLLEAGPRPGSGDDGS